MNKHYFCPKCHRRIEIPEMFKSANTKAEKGLNLRCANPTCGKGIVNVKLETIREEDGIDFRDLSTNDDLQSS